MSRSRREAAIVSGGVSADAALASRALPPVGGAGGTGFRDEMEERAASGPRASTFRHWLAVVWRLLRSTARLACGVPDYDTYVAHLRRAHPGRAIPSYEEFFAERQRARYGAGRSRCC